MTNASGLITQAKAVRRIHEAGLSTAGAMRIVMGLPKILDQKRQKVRAIDVAKAIVNLERLPTTSGVFISEKTKRKWRERCV